MCLLFADANAAEPSPDATRLTNLVQQDCGQSTALLFKGGLGKPLTPDALRDWDQEQLVHIILHGVPGTPMPPWRALLSKSDARWIAEQLKREPRQ